MKDKVKILLRPLWQRIQPFRHWLQLVRIYLYDYRRYNKFYANSGPKSKGKPELTGWILQDKHRIEKGLSLPRVRPNFGEAVLNRLLKNIKTYDSKFDKDNIYYWGVGAFQAYKNYHSEKGICTARWFDDLYNAIPEEDVRNIIATEVGLKGPERPGISCDEFRQFFTSRVSTRCFKRNECIGESLLKDITEIALKTPSVCNRQHWKVHIVSGNIKSKVLSLQNGNAGFGDDAPHLAIVTSSLKAFYLPGERVQAFTDGGMFAMSFLLSCHAHGVSSCALNWAASLKQDIQIRKLDIIEDDEAVVMLIALGYADETALIAKSPRKSVEEVLKFN